MSLRRCVVATSRLWRPQIAAEVARRSGVECLLIQSVDELTAARLAAFGADMVFFPHWSHVIPPEIHERFECVVFHMTNLPFGRGGSPLQNLIVRGIRQTSITALRCVAELDAGPIYLKRPLSLQGSARDIYRQANAEIEDMIVEILLNRPQPQPQSGTPVIFKRRRPEDGDIAGLETVAQVYDHVRMLDAPGYPPAFLQVGRLRLEFSRATLEEDTVKADVVIRTHRNDN